MGSASLQMANIKFDISEHSFTLYKFRVKHTENGELLCGKRLLYSHCYGFSCQEHCIFDSNDHGMIMPAPNSRVGMVKIQ